MIFRNGRKPNAIILIGLVFLFVASAWRLSAFHPEGSYRDAVTGFLYGLSIGLLLMGLIREHRSRTRA
jgi:hypothetical protein